MGWVNPFLRQSVLSRFEQHKYGKCALISNGLKLKRRNNVSDSCKIKRHRRFQVCRIRIIVSGMAFCLHLTKQFRKITNLWGKFSDPLAATILFGQSMIQRPIDLVPSFRASICSGHAHKTVCTRARQSVKQRIIGCADCPSEKDPLWPSTTCRHQRF